MQKSMNDVCVSTTQDEIFLTQSALDQHNDMTVAVNFHQVDLLIEWLKEAKAEIEKRHEEF